MKGFETTEYLLFQYRPSMFALHSSTVKLFNTTPIHRGLYVHEGVLKPREDLLDQGSG